MAARETERREAMQSAKRDEESPRRPEERVRTVDATEILGPTGMLRIELEGEVYTLRLTRNRRLILTK
jgi:hemin uptake protein HemP